MMTITQDKNNNCNNNKDNNHDEIMTQKQVELLIKGTK